MRHRTHGCRSGCLVCITVYGRPVWQLYGIMYGTSKTRFAVHHSQQNQLKRKQTRSEKRARRLARRNVTAFRLRPIVTDDIIKQRLLNEQEAYLSQRNRATRYIGWNLVNCCTAERKIAFEGPALGAKPWKSLKVIRIASIRPCITLRSYVVTYTVKVISRTRCKIETLLLQITNRKFLLFKVTAIGAIR